MENLNPSKKTIDLIARKPIAWVAGFLALLSMFFIGQSVLSKKDDRENCKETIDLLTKDKAESDAKAQKASDQLVQVLLTEKERREQDRRRQDSVINAVIGNKAKRIINQNQ